MSHRPPRLSDREYAEFIKRALSHDVPSNDQPAPACASTLESERTDRSQITYVFGNHIEQILAEHTYLSEATWTIPHEEPVREAILNPPEEYVDRQGVPDVGFMELQRLTETTIM